MYRQSNLEIGKTKRKILRGCTLLLREDYRQGWKDVKAGWWEFNLLSAKQSIELDNKSFRARDADQTLGDLASIFKDSVLSKKAKANLSKFFETCSRQQYFGRGNAANIAATFAIAIGTTIAEENRNKPPIRKKRKKRQFTRETALTNKKFTAFTTYIRKTEESLDRASDVLNDRHYPDDRPSKLSQLGAWLAKKCNVLIGQAGTWLSQKLPSWGSSDQSLPTLKEKILPDMSINARLTMGHEIRGQENNEEGQTPGNGYAGQFHHQTITNHSSQQDIKPPKARLLPEPLLPPPSCNK